MRNGCDPLGHARLVREERRIALRFSGVVAMHGPDWPFTHVAGNDQYPFLDQENRLSKISIREKGLHLLQFSIWHNPSLRNGSKELQHRLARAFVEEQS